MFLGRETWALSICENLNIRFYMPEVGRFGQVDPVTETQENYSLYQYSWGNPVLRSDPNGDFPIVPAIPFIIEAVKDAILAGAAIYTASELGKELSKGKIEIPTSGPSNNSSVPMWVQQRSKQMNTNEGKNRTKEFAQDFLFKNNVLYQKSILEGTRK